MFKTSMQPHILAPHLQAAFNQLPHTNLMPVKMALEKAVDFLLSVEPTESDLKNPDYGIQYAQEIEARREEDEIKSACSLLRMCHHAIERGETTESERHGIPLLLSSIVGFVPDRNKRASKKPRPNAKKDDALSRGIRDALRALTAEASFEEIASWLDDNGVIVKWVADKFIFTDGDNEETRSIGTLRNRISEIKNEYK